MPAFPDHPPGDIDWGAFPDLGALVAGRTARRASEEQRTFFLNSTGVGAQYSAVAHLIVTLAKAQGLGAHIPDELFSESISG